MQPACLDKTGTYILIFRLPEMTELRIGALGVKVFSRGTYIYTGSAFGTGGLKPRLRHHLFSTAAPRWHIDYLRACVKIAEIWFTADPDRLECAWAAILAGLPGSGQPVSGFGSSDCRCRSHLFHLSRKPSRDIFKQRIRVLHQKDFRLIK